MKELTNSLIAFVGGGSKSYGTCYCAANNSDYFIGIYSTDLFGYAEAFCRKRSFDNGYCQYQGVMEPETIHILNWLYYDKHRNNLSSFQSGDPSGLKAYALDC